MRAFEYSTVISDTGSLTLPRGETPSTHLILATDIL